MSDLLPILLGVLLATNAPLAVRNLAAQTAGVSAPVANPNDPVEKEYRQILEDDDAAEKEILSWSDSADASAKNGASIAQATLNLRIQKRLDGIRKEYQDFIDRHPNHVNARLAFGSFLNDTHDDDGAVKQWEEARQLAPNDPATWNNLANYYGHVGPVKKAFEYYDKAISLDANESVYYHNLAATVYLFRKDAGEYYHLTEQQVFDKSLDLYHKAIKLDPNNFVLFTDYAETFYGTNPPRWKDGQAAWKEALKITRNEAEREGVYLHLARIDLKLGQMDDCRTNLDAVTNANYAGLKFTLYANYAEAMSKTNSPSREKGLEAWEEALKLARDNAQQQRASIRLAQLQVDLGRFADARTNLNVVTADYWAPIKKELLRKLNGPAPKPGALDTPPGSQ